MTKRGRIFTFWATDVDKHSAGEQGAGSAARNHRRKPRKRMSLIGRAVRLLAAAAGPGLLLSGVGGALLAAADTVGLLPPVRGCLGSCAKLPSAQNPNFWPGLDTPAALPWRCRCASWVWCRILPEPRAPLA